jgi:outer membrane lipoprotein-sorting protein
MNIFSTGSSPHFIFWLRTAAVVVLLGGSALHAANPRDAVGAWLSAQTNLQTWSAAVKQIRSFKTMSQPLVETGRVWFAAPNRFRWEIGAPAKTIAVREPQQMLVIYPRLKRAERFPLNGPEAGPWKDALALLEAGFPRSSAELESRFKITATDYTNQLCQLTLQPRSPGARRMMPRLTVAFATNDFTLRATELQFADGSYMRNEFSNGLINPPIPGDLFQPTLDPGVEIVEPLKQKAR